MRFRNSTRLLIENFKNVYKILLYKLAIAVVAIALSCALLLPNLWDIVHSAEVTNLIDIVKDFFRALVTGDSQFLAGFQEQFKTMGTALLKLLDSRMSKIVWSVVGCGVVYLLERFLDTLCYFSIGSILNDRMATYAETPFAAAYIKNLGKASIYSIVYVPVVFLFDVMTIGLCYFLFVYLLAFNVLASLFFSMTFIVLCQALKLTITSMWLPAMAADNMSIGQAMRFGDKQQKKQWKKVFSTYVATIYIIIIINVIGAVCTFGSALLLTVPASFMLFICEQFVNYYTVQGKRYFITYDRIAINRDRGDSEHFFETVEDPDDFSILPEGEYTGEGSAPSDLENAERIAADLEEQLQAADRQLEEALKSKADLNAEKKAEKKSAANKRNKKEEIARRLKNDGVPAREGQAEGIVPADAHSEETNRTEERIPEAENRENADAVPAEENGDLEAGGADEREPDPGKEEK